MVAVASPQPNELEQKKRRQTLERAKANHLSKQLQMRLQYAKLKVEHGWQRQNLNEVENLYFHHSHLRNIRQGATQRSHYVAVAHLPAPFGAPPPTETHVLQPSAPSGLTIPTAGPSPAVNVTSCDHASSSSQSPSEHSESRPSSENQLYPTLQPTPAPVAPSSTPFDLSDPSILARLAQLQAQVQIPLQLLPQSQTLLRQPSATIIAPGTSPAPTSVSQSTPGAFPPYIQLSQSPASHSQPIFTFTAYGSQPPINTSTPGSTPLYPTLQPPVPSTVSASATTPTVSNSTAPIPAPMPIAPAALTYDSFWSTHASSTGPTRALYRTHTGFMASATPAGNVAMLTPGGHAAVMTAEGVYVGGGSSRSG